MRTPSDPLVYQLHTRDWLHRCAPGGTLNEVPDAELDRLAALGFDHLWLLGIWQTGQAGIAISRSIPALRAAYQEALPDLQDSDITGSTFAITAYTVHRDFGGAAALAALRGRMNERGVKVLLDFIPNHTALDHPWATTHPEFYVPGSAADLAREPDNFYNAGGHILARGRDPYFPAWTDTLQLNYGNPDLQSAMLAELSSVAKQCDAVRCDMAMLILPEIFQKTWHIAAEPFWEKAIPNVRRAFPDFLFVAEVYWDLDARLQQIGFDYTYDKRLYDALVEQNSAGVKARLSAGPAFTAKALHFLENHDEPRAAAIFPAPLHKAAAVVSFAVPGMRLFHDGELEGYRRRASIHLGRRAIETTDEDLASFYRLLLSAIQSTEGDWQVLETVEAWAGNSTFAEILVFARLRENKMRSLATVNYAPHQSQCYIRFPAGSLNSETVQLADLLGPESYTRTTADLYDRGLYLDLQPWSHEMFQLTY